MHCPSHTFPCSLLNAHTMEKYYHFHPIDSFFQTLPHGLQRPNWIRPYHLAAWYKGSSPVGCREQNQQTTVQGFQRFECHKQRETGGEWGGFFFHEGNKETQTLKRQAHKKMNTIYAVLKRKTWFETKDNSFQVLYYNWLARLQEIGYVGRIFRGEGVSGWHNMFSLSHIYNVHEGKLEDNKHSNYATIKGNIVFLKDFLNILWRTSWKYSRIS